MSIQDRTKAFCERFGLRVPILLAPLAGASAPSLSIAVANAGGLGACGALLMTPEEIGAWTEEVRAASNGAFQLNLWIPDPSPVRDPEHEARVREFLATWGPEVSPLAGDAKPQDFNAQCRALLDARAPIVSLQSWDSTRSRLRSDAEIPGQSPGSRMSPPWQRRGPPRPPVRTWW